MVWCCQATTHYLNQCLWICMTPDDVTMPQCVNHVLKTIVTTSSLVVYYPGILFTNWWVRRFIIRFQEPITDYLECNYGARKVRNKSVNLLSVLSSIFYMTIKEVDRGATFYHNRIYIYMYYVLLNKGLFINALQMVYCIYLYIYIQNLNFVTM